MQYKPMAKCIDFVELIDRKVNTFTEDYKIDIEKKMGRLKRVLLEACESAMEQSFLIEFIQNFHLERRMWDAIIENDTPIKPCIYIQGGTGYGEWRGWNDRLQLVIYPQYELRFMAHTQEEKNYRTDFLVTLERCEVTNEQITDYFNSPSLEFSDFKAWQKQQLQLYETICIPKVHTKLIVEIDGHDWHEKTKEQAKRDKERDRLMTTRGFVVFRFTGSEIYNDPKKAVFEVYSYLCDREKEIITRLGV